MIKLAISFIFLFPFFCGTAQRTRFTTFRGMSNYNGDIQLKRFTFQDAHVAAGIGLAYELTEQLYVITGIKYGKISATDSGTINKKRNLNFTSIITEFHAGLEYDFINLNERDLTPYIFGGIAVFHFNPYTKNLSNQKIYLQPLGTEGQGFFNGRKKYALTTFSIPVGGGFKFALTNNIRIGIEVGFRKTFTDYIDDVSTTYVNQEALLINNGAAAVAMAFRGDELKNHLPYPAAGVKRGNPKRTDLYYFSGITASYRLDAYTNYGYLSKYKMACPRNVF